MYKNLFKILTCFFLLTGCATTNVTAEVGLPTDYQFAAAKDLKCDPENIHVIDLSVSQTGQEKYAYQKIHPETRYAHWQASCETKVTCEYYGTTQTTQCVPVFRESDKKMPSYSNHSDNEKLSEEDRLFFQKSCDSGNLEHCLYLGDILTRGDEQTSGVALYKFACDKNNAYACLRLANSYFYGHDGLRKDLALASKYGKQACDLEVNTCDDLGKIYLAQHDDINAFKVFDRHCTRAVYPRESCMNAGDMLLVGRGTEKSESLALSMLLRACNHLTPEACAKVARLEKSLQQPKDTTSTPNDNSAGNRSAQ
jgi:hypothetical protein